MEKLLLFAVPLFWLVPLAWAVWQLRTEQRARSPLGRALVMGAGWQALWVAPAWLWQALSIDGGALTKLFFLVSWPVHCGGKTVTLYFEATVGDRQSTMLDHAYYFGGLTALQMLVFALVFALRYRSCGRLGDPVLIVLGGLALLNAALNITWPWWGS